MNNLTPLFIANRGEIACRIIRTAQRLGIRTVLGYSEADRRTLGVEMADETVCLGPARANESYLDQDRVLSAAIRAGARAIHPGYGFLSENAQFARKVLDAGLVWVGPSPEAMEKLSSKSKAKELARRVGVPVSPGHEGAQDEASLLLAARRAGYPVLLKAAAGGGGRGIRLVRDDQDLKTQLPLARSEALNAFGSDEILLEKYVTDAHHIEVQVFGDVHGNVVHLGERDCSAQRRHQKVLEESPSPALTPERRLEICSAAVRLARAAGYANAGTVEFLATKDAFYFLEVNTRLQVEHTVTEMVTGLDLVEWQLLVAAGGRLPLSQQEIRFSGHAVQARLYAEDPYQDFRPQTGRVEGHLFPEGARVDHFLTSGTTVSPFYDSMLAKVIVHAPDRVTALKDMGAALNRTVVAGLTTNRDYLVQILAQDFFRSGTTTTKTLEQTTFTRQQPPFSEEPARIAARAFAQRFEGKHGPLSGWSSGTMPASPDTAPDVPLIVTEQGVDFIWQGQHYHVTNPLSARDRNTGSADPDTVISPIDGTLTDVRVSEGQSVRAGDVLAVVEAMKMQMELKAPRDGRIARVTTQAGSQVKNRQPLFQLAPEAP